MTKVEIYTTRNCPYCNMAKSLLAKKEVSYQLDSPKFCLKFCNS
ncbi:MAG: glutaredoxin domain-containing protein [Desulfosalsimonas sp.]